MGKGPRSSASGRASGKAANSVGVGGKKKRMTWQEEIAAAPPKLCGSCEQMAGEIDKHGDGEIRVKWHRAERSRTSGEVYLTGDECYHCWDTRRRYFEDDVKTLNKKRQDNSSLDARYSCSRKDRVLKLGEYKHEEKKTADAWITEIEAEFCEAFEEGAFYTLQRFCKSQKIQHTEDDSDDTLIRKIRRVWPNMGIKKDSRLNAIGCWYVNDPNPNQGNYKFRRGAKQDMQTVKRTRCADDEMLGEECSEAKTKKGKLVGLGEKVAVAQRRDSGECDVAVLSDGAGKQKATPQGAAIRRHAKLMAKVKENHTEELEWSKRPKTRVHDSVINSLAKSARELARFTGDKDCSSLSEQAGRTISLLGQRLSLFEEIKNSTAAIAQRTTTSAEHQVMLGCAVRLRAQIVQQASFSLAGTHPPLMLQPAACPRIEMPDQDSNPHTWPRIDKLCLGLLLENVPSGEELAAAASLAVRTQTAIVSDMIERIVLESPSEQKSLEMIAEIKAALGEDFTPFDFDVTGTGDAEPEPHAKCGLFEQSYVDISVLIVIGDAIVCMSAGATVAGELRKQAKKMLSVVSSISTRVRNLALATVKGGINNNIFKRGWAQLSEMFPNDTGLDSSQDAADAAAKFKTVMVQKVEEAAAAVGDSADIAYNVVVDLCGDYEVAITEKFCSLCIVNADPSDFDELAYSDYQSMATKVVKFLCTTLMGQFTVEDLQGKLSSAMHAEASEDMLHDVYWVGHIFEHLLNFAPKWTRLHVAKEKVLMANAAMELVDTCKIDASCATGLREWTALYGLDQQLLVTLQGAADGAPNELFEAEFVDFLRCLTDAWSTVQVATPLASFVQRVVHSAHLSDTFLSVAEEFDAKLPDDVKLTLTSARSMKALERAFNSSRDGRPCGLIELTGILTDCTACTNAVRDIGTFAKQEKDMVRLWKVLLRDAVTPDMAAEVKDFLSKYGVDTLAPALDSWTFTKELAFITDDKADVQWDAKIKRLGKCINASPTNERIIEFLGANMTALHWASDAEKDEIRSLTKGAAHRTAECVQVGVAVSCLALANCICAAPESSRQRALDMSVQMIFKRFATKLEALPKSLQTKVSDTLGGQVSAGPSKGTHKYTDPDTMASQNQNQDKSGQGCSDCAPVVHCDCPPVEPTSFKEVIHERTPALEQAGLLAGVLATGVLIGVQFERLAPGSGAGRCARRRPAAQAGSKATQQLGEPTPAVEALDLAGEFFAMRYNVGGPELWHARCFFGTPLTYLVGVGVMTPDRDEYEEELLRGGDVLDWVRLPGPDSVVAQAGPHAAYHRFRVLPTVAELTLALSIRWWAGHPRQAHPQGKLLLRLSRLPRGGVQRLALLALLLVALRAPRGQAAPPAMLRQPLHLRPPPCSRLAPLEGSPLRAGVSPPLEGASLASPLSSVLRPNPLSLPVRPRRQEALSRRPPRRRSEPLHLFLPRPLRLPRPSVLVATLGTDLVRGNFCIVPALSEWIASELSKEYSVMKERRKARGERVLAVPKKGPKGNKEQEQGRCFPGQLRLRLASLHELKLIAKRRLPSVLLGIGTSFRSLLLALALAPALREPSTLGQDGLPAVSLQRASDTAGAGYVDNFMVLGSDRAAVQGGLDKVCRRLEPLGLSVHELSPASRDVSFVGLEFTSGSTVSVKAKNLWRLRYGIEALFRRGVCSGSALQVIMGHITWIAFFRREVLAFFSASYKYMQSVGETPQKLWRTPLVAPTTLGMAPKAARGRRARTKARPTSRAGLLKGQRASSATRLAKQRQARGNLSLPERLAVKPGTERLYLGAAAAFASFCQSIGADWSSPQELGTLLVSYFNAEFLEGSSVEEASKLLASLSHFPPELYKATAEKLPTLALAGCLRHLGHPRMCLWAALTFIAYLRPLETFQLRGTHLAAPKIAAGRQCSSRGLLLHDASVGDPGKTGMFDAVVLLDRCDWLLPSLEALKAQSHPDGSLWDFSPAELQRLFASLVQVLGLDPLSPHLYSLRHGKTTRLILEMAKLPEDVFVLGRAVEANFSNVMSEGFAGPLSAVRLPSRLAAALGPGSAIRRGLPAISPRAKSAGIYSAASGPAPLHKPIRSSDMPFGVPDLSEAEKERIRIGNASFMFSVVLIKMCISLNVPVFLENPRAAIMWWTPQMKDLMLSSVFFDACSDFCQYAWPRGGLAVRAVAVPGRAQRRGQAAGASSGAAAARVGATPVAPHPVSGAAEAAARAVPSGPPRAAVFRAPAPALPEWAALEPVLAPAGAGALLVFLLTLRRGDQPYTEQLPLRYDGPWIEAYWQRRPLRLWQRFADVGAKCGAFSLAIELDKLLDRVEEMEPQRAVEARDLITDLGPAFVKIVQVWASRPDVLPEAYNRELEKLLERVRPFDKEEAMLTLRRNFPGEGSVEAMFDDMGVFEKPVASASIGQVYKATMDGREVAVKVQRPDVREQVTLDLYVIRRLAALGSLLPIERFSRQFSSLFDLIDRVAPPFIEELDYEFEANSQRRFAELIYGCELVADSVAVPEVVAAKREVLVQEWLPGKKLTEPGAASDQASQVVKVLLNAYMVQFLETGLLHGDPHPGNFVLMPSGKIGILDYGLVTHVAPNIRVSFIEYIMHVQAKMYDECLIDLINLGFLPEGLKDDKEAREVIVPGLASTLTILFEQSDLRKQREKFVAQRENLASEGKLEKLQEELRAIARKYGSFRLPGYTTLIIRALATLEGVGMSVNNNFSLNSELFPYIARRLLTDDSLRIREALRAYLYRGRKRIDLKRVDDLASGFRSFTNLMKGSAEVRANVGGAPAPQQPQQLHGLPAGARPAPLPEPASLRSLPPPAAAAGGEGAAAGEEGAGVEMAAKDIAVVLFSPQGNYLQDVLIDEGVAAVDALSRAALVQLLGALGPLAFPVSAPLALLLGVGDARGRLLTREDKEALLLIRRLSQYAQAAAQPEGPLEPAGPGRFGELARAAQALRQLQPLASGLLPALGEGAASFAQRFVRKLASRIVERLAEGIEVSAGLGPLPGAVPAARAEVAA
ncbi:unnamed protein product [Prorocentrum cordatum]|uniref:ABC1 atypical kinase-like domain-containing protein n=1 Tax=Prorocentrum cordatum TaxID=2364126 RepID=A0ABN9UJH3_9DINO|nr:unnamed protein product [Polarella glacialis]